MKNYKLRRNIWVFVGVCFILSIFLLISEDKPIDFKFGLFIIAGVASFINAYRVNKKI